MSLIPLQVATMSTFDARFESLAASLTALEASHAILETKVNLSWANTNAIFHSHIIKAASRTLYWAQTSRMSRWVSPSGITKLDKLVMVIRDAEPTQNRATWEHWARKVYEETQNGAEPVSPTHQQWLHNLHKLNTVHIPVYLNVMTPDKFPPGGLKTKATTELLKNLQNAVCPGAFLHVNHH